MHESRETCCHQKSCFHETLDKRNLEVVKIIIRNKFIKGVYEDKTSCDLSFSYILIV